jgi:catechol-2,3-dioxygenase
MEPIARLRAVVLDCPDPRSLAQFYRDLVGGEVLDDDDDWVRLRDGGNVLLSFQRVEDYRAPEWPSADNPQQFHIDVTVDGAAREEAESRVLALGARRHEVQPGLDEGDPFVVYLDPVGHPFCFCWD